MSLGALALALALTVLSVGCSTDTPPPSKSDAATDAPADVSSQGDAAADTSTDDAATDSSSTDDAATDASPTDGAATDANSTGDAPADASSADAAELCTVTTEAACKAQALCTPVYGTPIIDGSITGDAEYLGCHPSDKLCGATGFCTWHPNDPSKCWYNPGNSCVAIGWLYTYWCDSPPYLGPCALKPPP